MISREKVTTVTAREFLATVRRISYLVFTFGMPLFATLYIGLFAALPVFFIERKAGEAKTVGVVDLTRQSLVRFEAGAGGEGELPEALTEALTGLGKTGARGLDPLPATVSGNISFLSLPSEAAALEALREGDLLRYYVVPPDYLETGAMKAVLGRESAFIGASGIGDRFRDHLRDSVLRWGRVEETVRERVERPMVRSRVEVLALQEDGSLGPEQTRDRIARMAVPGAFALLLLMSLMFSSGYLLQGVSEEKENRVMEVLLSSLRPDELLMGKILGLGAAGLLQLLVWVSVVLLAGLSTAVLAGIDAGLLLLCLVLFLLGFLLVGTLMTGTGALGGTAKESQQLASLWSLITILPPAMTWMVIIDDPNGGLARILSYIPFTSPISLMLRLGAGGLPGQDGGVPWWDLGLSLLLLSLGVWIALKLGAKLFRLGLLMTGKRPSLRNIVRMLRAA